MITDQIRSTVYLIDPRGIRFVSDSIGRDAISAGDAQRLLAEQREHELRKQAVLKLQSSRRLRLMSCGGLRFGRVCQQTRSLQG
jgi:hypothetical protein